MTGGDFDIGATLRKRLQEITQKKESIGTRTETAREKLQKLISKSKPVRSTREQLDQKILELETKRTSTSLPLAEEKSILRQIDQIQKSKIQVDENKEHEQAIQDKKSEIELLRSEMRSMTAQIAELESAVAKIELANRLGCTTNDLETSAVDCPVGKLGEIIGKGGSNIKQLEQMTGCIIDVDKVKSQVHLRGNADAIQKAVEAIESVTQSVEDEIRLSAEVHSFLFGNGMAPYKELRNNHANVFVDLSKDSKMMKLRGKMEAITAVKDDIAKINVTMETVAVTGREAGLVIGKGGATIKALTEKFDVGLDVKDSKDDTAIIDIVGISINVAAAVKEINDMIFQNQDVDTNIFCSKLFKNKCLEKAGAMIKELQKEINAALDCNGVRIQFEGRDRGEGEMESSGALLEIRSSRTHHASAVELVKKRVAEYEAKTLVIKFESHVIPAIIGKGGEKINELKKLGKGATIELDRVIGEVSVLATDETTKNLVKDAIEEIIAQNQVLKVPVEDSMMGLMFGFNGKEFRATITSKNVSLNHEGIDAVVLKGSIENITECAGLLRDFMASNYKIEVEFEAGDSNLLSRKDSVLFTVQNEGEVKTYVVRSRNVVEIRGKENKVKAAAAEIRKFLYGSNDITVLKVPVPDAIIGAIIGKGGSNISKLEKENEGVTVDVNSITNAMTIRGEESAVYLCRGAVLKEMVNVNANDSIKVDLDVLEQLSDNRCIRKITDGLPVNVTVTASQVKLRGNYIDVANVKAAVEELANGSYQGQVTLSSSLLRALLSNDGSKPLFEIIQNESGANVELHEESSSIKITGKKSFVKRAKFSIFDHLESNYNYCFSKLVVPKHIAKVAYDTKEITNMAADTGCDIVFDSDVHALLIQSASSERLATGFEGAQEYVKKCGSLVFTVVVKPDESWLLLSLLTQYRNSLKELEESCNCKLDVFKEESVVSVSVKGDQDIQDGQEALLGLIEKIKCENAFVCIPESSMPQFIGQSSKHINSFAATHSVQIERVKKSPTLIRIHGQEKEVKHAATAVKDWAEGWESKHPGTNVNVDITTLEILDSASSDEKTNICRDCGVKMDVNMATFTVVIRGGKGTAHKRAVDAIEALARSNDEECRRNEPPKKSMVPLVKSQPQPIPEVMPMKFTPPMPPKVTSIPADVVVEKKRKNEAAKKKVSKLQTASNLFNFLISEDPVPTKSSDDASTVSSGLENTDDGYFRSTSGFTIRL